MADKTFGGVPGRSDLDPFAELTRIMGFDPRVPVAQQEEAAEPVPDEISAAEPEPAISTGPMKVAAEDDTSGSDDFSIDLEKELLGEFPGQDASDFEAAPAVAHSSGELGSDNLNLRTSKTTSASMSTLSWRTMLLRRLSIIALSKPRSRRFTPAGRTTGWMTSIWTRAIGT